MNIVLGGMSKPLTEQLALHDIALPEKEGAFLDKMQDAVTLLYVRNIITESEKVKAHKRLIRELERTLKQEVESK